MFWIFRSLFLLSDASFAIALGAALKSTTFGIFTFLTFSSSESSELYSFNFSANFSTSESLSYSFFASLRFSLRASTAASFLLAFFSLFFDSVAFLSRNSLPLNLSPSFIAALIYSYVSNITKPIPLPMKVFGSLTSLTFLIWPNFAKWAWTSSSEITKGKFPTKTVVLKSSIGLLDVS